MVAWKLSFCTKQSFYSLIITLHRNRNWFPLTCITLIFCGGGVERWGRRNPSVLSPHLPPPPPKKKRACRVLTSVEKDGLNCLCRSMITRRITSALSSFSTSRSKNMVDKSACKGVKDVVQRRLVVISNQSTPSISMLPWTNYSQSAS